jgi:NADH-quinone oxidoreductase subunit M
MGFMTPDSLIVVIVFLPLVGSLLALATGYQPRLCRWVSLSLTLIELALISLLFCLNLKPQAGPTGVWLLAVDYPWLEVLGARFSLGLDGLSLMLLLLTAFTNVICVLISWEAINTRVGLFHFFLLFLEGCLMGLFMATDLLLFYLFWEIQLIPMFFLVGVWGHTNRVYAALKFILFTFGGSVFMLIALVALYVIHGHQSGVYTFSLYQLSQTLLSPTVEGWLYIAFLLAFAIKIPLVPVHTWLPDAHTEAPTAGSVDLAGLLLKTGFYAFFRFAFPLFPGAAQASMPLLLALGLVGMFYAAWIALAQTDIKRLIAYSSIGHMGMMVIALGIWNLMALSGSLLQLINHGISTSALFVMVGMMDERIGSRDFRDLGGLWKQMPVFSAFFLFFALSSMGLPGLNNFVGEILILIGTFQVRPVIAVLAFVGVILSVIYILRMIHDSLFGEARKEHHLWDVKPREIFILVVMALPVLFIGLHPGPVLRLLDSSIRVMLLQFPLLAHSLGG